MRSKRLARLDDLRAVAAVMVFVCHLGLLWPVAHFASEPPLQTIYAEFLGRFGVAVFFVVSGLVIYRPFIGARESGQPIDHWAYTVRRLTRIVPPYWLALAVFAVVLPLEVTPVGSGVGSMFWGFGQIYSQASYGQGLPVAWSLGVELSFYMAVPVFALALRRRASIEPFALLGLWIASLIVRIASPQGVVGGTILGYLGWFAIGMGLARLSRSAPKLPIKAPLIWAAAAAGFLLLARHLPLTRPNQGVLLDYVGLGLLAGLVVLPAVTHPAAARLKWLGDRSYGFYLWHFPILAWLAAQQIGFAEYATLGVVLTSAAAHFSYRYLEQPLMVRAGAFAAARRRGRVPAAIPLLPSHA